MGFFSNLKNMVTGGGADISLVIPELEYGQDSVVNLTVKIKDVEIKSEELYLELQCNYHCHEIKIDYLDENKDGTTDKIQVTKLPIIRKVDSKKIQVNGSKIYSALSMHEFPVKLNINKPDFISSNNQIAWKALAGLAVTGNDPDSGWTDFNVKSDMKFFSCDLNLILLLAEGKTIKKLKLKAIANFHIHSFDELIKHIGFINELDPFIEYMGNLVQGYCQDYLQNKLKDISSGSFNLSGLDLLNYMKNLKDQFVINNSILINYMDIVEFNLTDYVA